MRWNFTLLCLQFCLISLMGQVADQKREKIGEVLGKPVYRDQISTNENTKLKDEMRRLFISPASQKYMEDHKKELEPTKEEIELTQAFFEKQHKEKLKDREGELKSKLAKVKKELAQENLTEERRKELQREKFIIETELRPLSPGFGRFVLENWKLQRHLYDKCGGGRVQWQTVGVQVFDASKAFVESLEKKGDIKVFDPKLREEMYAYWKNPRGVIEDEEEIKNQFLEPEWSPVKLRQAKKPPENK